ncbi:hypothetical protein R3P38DRAFT_3595417 [Favolaschia claudopus]|uniref:Uncharacterized protein n=1 Tax=Favolaschia claudopus TaxID=2862362 RepID=A0AAW0DIS1_9AGAR
MFAEEFAAPLERSTSADDYGYYCYDTEDMMDTSCIPTEDTAPADVEMTDASFGFSVDVNFQMNELPFGLYPGNPDFSCFSTQISDANYEETGDVVNPTPPVFELPNETLPAISELKAQSSPPPPLFDAYTIPAANISPELWYQESLRSLAEDTIPEPEPPKAASRPSFIRPIAPNGRMRKHSRGLYAKILFDSTLPRVSPEEVENIRKLQREAEARWQFKRLGHLVPKRPRMRKAVHFAAPSPSPSLQSDDPSEESGSSESELDEASSVSESDYSVDSSFASDSSTRSLSSPPGRSHRLMRMEEHRRRSRTPGIAQTVLDNIVEFWFALTASS